MLAVSISGANAVCCGLTTPLTANVNGGSGDMIAMLTAIAIARLR